MLGQRFTDDDNLRSLQQWLYGERTGAVVTYLAFAAGTQQPVPGLPAGRKTQATVALYPGTCPARVLIGERASGSEELGPLPGEPSWEAALNHVADCLSADPWADVIPLAVRSVTVLPADQWLLRDTAGRALPVTAAASVRWGLLALSGGRPVDVAGEWDGFAFTPQAAAPTGERGRLLRRAAQLPGAALEAIVLDAGDDQARLLHSAAVVSRARRAGYRPPEAGQSTAPAPAEDDHRPEVCPAAERRLADLLGAGDHDLIAEWLRCLAALDRAKRPPDALVPALLTAAAGRPVLRASLLPVLGPLVGWLAGFNGEWAWACGPAVPGGTGDRRPAGAARQAAVERPGGRPGTRRRHLGCRLLP